MKEQTYSPMQKCLTGSEVFKGSWGIYSSTFFIKKSRSVDLLFCYSYFFLMFDQIIFERVFYQEIYGVNI